MKIEFPEYDYPKKLFDFTADVEIGFERYRELEKYIQIRLVSSNINQIKDGLSNVLYWGYYRTGYGKIRVERFRNKVTNYQLQSFSALIKTNDDEPINIRKIGMPEFSGFSFISKIKMFLDPSRYVILDKKIMKLQDPNNQNNPLSKIAYNDRNTGIRVTKNSQKYYQQWCELCNYIANQYFNDTLAIDVERGFFKLVEQNELIYGKNIISSVTKNYFL